MPRPSGLQDAVDGRVDVIGGSRVSRRNSQVSAEQSVSRVPESYTQKPTIVRVRTASGRSSPAVGKGVSNSNLHIVKTRMTGQAAGSDGVMYNVRGLHYEPRTCIIRTLAEFPHGTDL